MKAPIFRTFLAVCLLTAGTGVFAQKLSDDEIIKKWIGTNSGVSRLQMRFSQTQSMKTVKAPLISSGILSLDMPNKRFRWEGTGMIVIGDGKDITLQRTIGKKYEKKRSTAEAGGAGMAAMAKGLPKTVSAFKSQYKVLKISKGLGYYSVVTQPLSSSSKGVKTFTFKVDSSDYALQGFLIVLKDGSRVNSSFTNVKRNPTFPAGHFKPDLEGYTEVKD